jgi:hypothetical protein
MPAFRDKIMMKSKYRKDLKRVLAWLETALFDAHFFFNHRHEWDDENGGYEFCRHRFYSARRSVKAARRFVAFYAGKLCNEYVN